MQAGRGPGGDGVMRNKGVTGRRASAIAFGALWCFGVGAAPGQDPDVRVTNCTGNRSPVADAGANLEVFVGDEVSFDGRSSYDPDGAAIVRFAWTFGNGLYGRDAVSTTTYTVPGTYSVTLTVMDACRARGSDVIQVSVLANDESDPCEGNLVPTANPGPNQLNRPVGELVSFSGAGSSDSDGEIVAFAWDFGDGSVGTGSSVSHRYNTAGNFIVQLTVTDDCGAIHRRSAYVTVVSACSLNQAPTADAGANRSALRGETISFDGGGSRDPEGQISAYQWLWGDGTSASGRTASKSYSAAGNYTVTLRVTDSCGVVASDTASVTVNDPTPPPPTGLNANFTVSSNAPRVRENITFTSAMASNPAGLWFYWDFGDGVAGYGGATVTRSYADPGTYSALLTVFRDGTWESATSAPVTVNVSAGMTLQGLVEGYFVYDSGVEILNGYVWAVGSPGKIATVDARNGSPTLLKVQTLAGTTYDVASNGTLVGVAGGYGGVYLFNGADPVNQGLRGQYNTYNTDAFEAFGIAFSGNVMYVAGGWNGLRVVDVSNPASPRLITTVSSPGSLRQVELAGTRLYCSDPSLPGVRVFNISNSTAPSLMGSIRTAYTTTRLAAQGNRLACVQGYRGVELLDVTNVSAPISLARLLEGNPSSGVELTSNRAYVGYLASVVEMDISNPQAPTTVTSVGIGNQAGEVHMSNGRLFAGRWTGVVAVLQP